MATRRTGTRSDDDELERRRDQPTTVLEEEIAAYLAEFGVDDESHAIVRPYARTGGRTRALTDLAIEALLTCAPVCASISVEHAQVREICREPTSVAEIAAYTRLPIGAARVIIGDMLELGLLHRCAGEVSATGATVDLMVRVLGGLRRL